MSQATTRTGWTFDEYLDWESRQPTKHEFVDGRVHPMVGGTSRHDVICNNLRGLLWDLLRGNRCRVQGPNLKLRTGDNARYPDALIDCGPLAPTALIARDPVAVFEVLSKSTAWIDQTLKLRDYETTQTIRSYVLISQDEPRVLIYRRDEAGRFGANAAILLENLVEAISLDEPAVTIPLTVLYEGLDFPPDLA